jgi:hypothetical protein
MADIDGLGIGSSRGSDMDLVPGQIGLGVWVPEEGEGFCRHWRQQTNEDPYSQQAPQASSVSNSPRFHGDHLRELKSLSNDEVQVVYGKGN